MNGTYIGTPIKRTLFPVEWDQWIIHKMGPKKGNVILFRICPVRNLQFRRQMLSKRICDEWSMPKQTVSSILKKFESEGYIFLVTDEDDRRNKKIILTEKGNRFAGGLLDELYRIESSVIQKIGPADMEEILRGNRLFYEYFQEEID